ncbi:hypothetical protein RchiOBHm_Chr2g0115481 [Rosa chinensis]|uniref:Uncharacterized protein n=1 Tax=Rosa chinensis TaxID=74649 RepID=A0A2P6RR08_ROSCH|nr:hypothetical protein RchiOBHm_Chr2g0115481 [Rosa chinensis]
MDRIFCSPRRYDPSGYLIRRAISSSLLVGDSSTEVHQHHDKPGSTINPRGKEKELHTSSLSNTN